MEDAYVRALYSDQPLQCSRCGLRYPQGEQAQLDKHSDWHFRRSQKQRDVHTHLYRGWTYRLADWASYVTEDAPGDKYVWCSPARVGSGEKNQARRHVQAARSRLCLISARSLPPSIMEQNGEDEDEAEQEPVKVRPVCLPQPVVAPAHCAAH